MCFRISLKLKFIGDKILTIQNPKFILEIIVTAHLIKPNIIRNRLEMEFSTRNFPLYHLIGFDIPCLFFLQHPGDLPGHPLQNILILEHVRLFQTPDDLHDGKARQHGMIHDIIHDLQRGALKLLFDSPRGDLHRPP